ncbi:hypothetical protein R3P38DRAFT_2906047 [Favolaschia claudopus]|uniref:Uncharacterized protein n=1 Tax=Favolaschia claudopus TaxID=2862362 RepID=A0AAW0CHS7_9AGAR
MTWIPVGKLRLGRRSGVADTWPVRLDCHSGRHLRDPPRSRARLQLPYTPGLLLLSNLLNNDSAQIEPTRDEDVQHSVPRSCRGEWVGVAEGGRRSLPADAFVRHVGAQNQLIDFPQPHAPFQRSRIRSRWSRYSLRRRRRRLVLLWQTDASDPTNSLSFFIRSTSTVFGVRLTIWTRWTGETEWDSLVGCYRSRRSQIGGLDSTSVPVAGGLEEES